MSPRKSPYGYRWQKVRLGHLRNNPLCVMCAQLGKQTAATVVDHVEPHRGDMVLFWDPKNRQSLCEPCHNRHKQRLEKSGTVSGCDIDGLPIDPTHPWHPLNQGVGAGKKSQAGGL